MSSTTPSFPMQCLLWFPHHHHQLHNHATPPPPDGRQNHTAGKRRRASLRRIGLLRWLTGGCWSKKERGWDSKCEKSSGKQQTELNATQQGNTAGRADEIGWGRKSARQGNLNFKECVELLRAAGIERSNRQATKNRIEQQQQQWRPSYTTRLRKRWWEENSTLIMRWIVLVVDASVLGGECYTGELK